MHLICDPCPETCGTDKISECPIIIKVKKRRATRIRRKILIYNPKGNLAQTAQLILAFTEVNHASTKDHIERVAYRNVIFCAQSYWDSINRYFII